MRYLSVITAALFLNSCAPAFIGGIGVGALAIEDRRTAATIFEDQTIKRCWLLVVMVLFKKLSRE